MGLVDDFTAGLSELTNDPGSFAADSVPGMQGSYVPDTFGSTSGADFGPQDGKTPVAPNNAFVAGVNELINHPLDFFGSIPAWLSPAGAIYGESSGNTVDATPKADINKAATKSIAENLPTIPTWVKVLLITGVVVVGLVAIGFTAHEIRKV